MTEKVINVIKGIVREEKRNEVLPVSLLQEDLEFDSMMTIKLLLGLEDECGVDLEELNIDLTAIKSVADVITALETSR